MPIGLGGFLPNKFYYYHIKKNVTGKPSCTINKIANRNEITSDNIKNFGGHYVNFKFDNNGLVESTTYLVIKYFKNIFLRVVKQFLYKV